MANLHESLRNLLLRTDEELAQQFYKIVIAKHPDIGRFFEGVDMRYQAAILTIGLESVIQYFVSRVEFQKRYLIRMGHKHYKLGIPRELFPKFSAVLIEVVKDFHKDDWTAELEHQWNEALHLGIETMFLGYVDELPGN
ncbi:Flavohemoprotein [Planctomycetes bacterium Pan216]|uniref:Flavohemoprotein n=1 Tax=Kolteria novifilia TaxID=2527975 RepID=A0A518AYT1_9BACT|nr:Flavohemoprotein [Planctomycetes bacterium Pan216]